VGLVVFLTIKRRRGKHWSTSKEALDILCRTLEMPTSYPTRLMLGVRHIKIEDNSIASNLAPDIK
jgi:hypothetical protein